VISGAPLGSAATMSTRASEAVEKIMPKINTVRGIENRKVVSQSEWLVARKKLLLEENTTYNFLDLTAKGRDETPKAPQDWVR
jgi:predicted dithiol-disulfide oxidoreductase (DUF899 family)